MGYAPSKAAKAAYSAPLATAGYVSEVDALRCVAMTGVVATHCDLLPFGWAGVWLFYVISGFAITSSLLASDRMSHSKPVLLRNFYAKRCLRIWPIYFLVVGPTLIAAAIAGQRDVLALGPWLVTFTANYYNIFPITPGAKLGIGWAICGPLASKSNSTSSSHFCSGFSRGGGLSQRFGFASHSAQHFARCLPGGSTSSR